MEIGTIFPLLSKAAIGLPVETKDGPGLKGYIQKIEKDKFTIKCYGFNGQITTS